MNVYILFQLGVTVAAGVLLGVAILKRKQPRSFFFTLLTLSVFLFSLGYLQEVAAPSLDAAMVGNRLQRSVLLFSPLLYYLYVREHYNRSIRSKVQLALLAAPPGILALLILSGAPLPVYYADVQFVAQPFSHLVIEKGPLYYISLVYLYACLLAGLAIILRFLINDEDVPKRQSLFYFLVSLCPLVIITIRLFDVPPVFDFTAAVLVATEIILLYQLRQFGMVDWMPYARDSVLENINDAFILIDTDNRFLDANAVALSYFPDMMNVSAGTPVSRINDFPKILLESEDEMEEFTLERPNGTVHLRSSRSNIHYGTQVVCTCIMLYDITEIRQLVEELNDLATHDALTGLYNRGTFFRLAERDFSLAIRARAETSVMMIDLDFFKTVNDMFGHQCGDRVLERTSDILMRRLRHTDIIGRYGGEEFCVFLPNTGEEGAATLAETLRGEVAGALFVCEDTEFHVTVSIGVAVLDHERHDTLESLISSADDALYKAKTNGRDQVCFY